MTPLRQVDQDKILDPSELVEIINDLYRRLRTLEVGARMIGHSESR